MKELIKITEQNGKQAVSARELHAFVEMETRFDIWIKRMLEYGFTENVDFQCLNKNVQMPNGGYKEAIDDYALTLDCAKEIAMIQKNDKGKQARKYFITCEEQLKQLSTPQNYAAALRQLADVVEEKEKAQMLLAEKTLQLDESKKWYTVKRYAKENGLNWRKINWRKLKAISHEHGYEVKKIFDANYGEINVYHIDAWKLAYPKLQLV